MSVNRLLAGAFTIAFAVGAAAPAPAAEFDLTLASLPVPGSLFDLAISGVPKRIEQATGGRVKITVNDSLVGGTQLAPAVRDGRVDMVAAIHPYLSAQEPRMGLANLPGLIVTVMDYKFVFDAFYGADLAAIWKEKWNATVLAEGLWAPQAVFSKVKLEKLEDFRGLKIRVHNKETAILMDAIGAKPTPMSGQEMMAGLERGVIDAITTSFCFGYHQGFWRVAKNVYNWGIAPMTGWAVLANNQVWAKIPADLQTVILQEMAKMQEEMFREFYDNTRHCIQEMESKGVPFQVAKRSEVARLLAPEHTEGVYKWWYERAKEVGFDGEDYVRRARNILGVDLR